jgi:precorrin-6A/cobalt-precorrin-6A reductase
MRLLLLAGIPEAARIAGALAREHRVAPIASLPRAVRAPVPLGVPTRIGGWGGEAQFRDWLRRERVHAILDVTHPFDVRISDRAFRAAADLGLDYLRFQRPPWTPGPEDNWTFLNDCGEVAQKVPEGATLLLDTGGRGGNEVGHLDRHTVHCRLDARLAPPALPNGARWHYLDGRAPYDAETEARLYDRLGIDWVVLLNTGGSEDRPKLEAARRLGLGMGIVRRPPRPEAPRTETVSEVMRWVRRRL